MFFSRCLAYSKNREAYANGQEKPTRELFAKWIENRKKKHPKKTNLSREIKLFKGVTLGELPELERFFSVNIYV
jgi:hypothetical protein